VLKASRSRSVLVVLGSMCVAGLFGPGIALASPPTTAIRYVYDADGQLKGMINPASETAFYGWDPAGNLLSIGRASSTKLSVIVLAPAHGPVGETVTISGTGFSTTKTSDTVKFNGTKATVSAATAVLLTVKVPSGATSGTVSVQTTTEGPVTSAQSFTVASAPAPSITSLSSTVASPGSEVTISGANFEASTLYNDDVALNRSRPELVSEAASAIKFKVPGATGGGFVSVATPQGSAVGPELFIPPNGISSSRVGATGVVALNGSTTAKVTKAAENVALETFEGVGGQRVSLVLSEATYRGQVSIWGPEGSEVYGSGEAFEGERTFVQPVTLPSTGTYTILVEPEGSATGSVKLSPYLVVSDVTGSISPTAEGAKQSVSITSPGQRAIYSVAVTAGEAVSLKTSSTSFNGHYWLEWVNPEGTKVREQRFSETENAFMGQYKFPTTGTYTLVVNPYGGYTGSTSLTAYNASDVTGTIAPSAEGESKTVTTTVPGQFARITFSGTSGERVSLASSEATDRGQVSILTPEGATVSGSTETFESERRFMEPVTLSSTGTYTILVEPEGAATGSVKLSAYSVTDVTGSITPTAEGAKQSVSIATPGQRAIYSVAVTEGEAVSLKTSSTSFNGHYWLEWFNPEGKNVKEQEFPEAGNGFMGQYRFPTTGTYKLIVNPYGGHTGSTTLTAYNASDVTGSITPSVEGESKTVTTSVPGQFARITFSGTSGQTITLKARESTIANGWMSVWNPAGSKLSGSEANFSGEGASVEITLSATGTYTILLEPSGEDTGHVKLTAYLGSHPGLVRRLSSSKSAASLARPAPLDLGGASRAARSGQTAKHLQLGATALSGQVLAQSGLPLTGVRVSLEGTPVAAETDEAGRFLLSGGVPAGRQLLVVEGDMVPGHQRYGSYEVGVNVTAGQTTILPYTIWLTPLDPAGNHYVGSPTKREARLTTPRIPGLEVRIPAGSVITDAAGHTVRKLNITAIPVDRPPFPLPLFAEVPLYFTVQPGRAYLSKGAQIVYPNWGHQPAGQRVDFWNYDADTRGWYVYGKGTVTPNGKQVVPDANVRVWELTGAMISLTPEPPKDGPKPGVGAWGGDPVDLRTGLYVYRKKDLVLPDTIPIVIERTYRQGYSNSYGFGIGTDDIYDMRLWSENNFHEADLILPNGGRVHYVRTSPGEGYREAVYESTSSPGIYYASTLKWNESENGWDVTLTNGLTYEFGVYAPLQSIRDRFGNKLILTRESGTTGNITQITSPHGRWVKLAYEGSLITEITDNAGRKLKYAYKSGLLEKVTDTAGRTTSYEYNTEREMTAVTDGRGKTYAKTEYEPSGKVSKQTEGDGGIYKFAYSEEGGHVVATTVTDPQKTERRLKFNSEGFPTSEINALGTSLQQTTSYEPQAATGLPVSVTDPLGRKTTYQYDSSGNITQETLLAGTSSARTLEYTYEPGTNGRTSFTNGLKHTTKYQYGTRWELLSETDPLGHKTSAEYNADGQPVTITNALGKTTKLGYAFGDLTSVTDPLGRTTKRFLDTVGRVTSLTTPGGERTLYEDNADNQPIKVTDPLGASTSYEYDGDGNLAATTDPNKHKSSNSYDPLDRLESETDPLEHSTKAVHNQDGDLTELTDRNGKLSKFSYDALDRLTEAKYGVSGETAESTIKYEYDNANRVTKVIDSATGTYTPEYDEFDRVKSLATPNGTISYEYNEADLRTSMTVPGQEPVKYKYDEANRLTEIKRGSQIVSLAYDNANRPTTTTLVDGIEEAYGYDEANELTSITYKKGATKLGELDYAYSPNGLREAVWGTYARTGLPEAFSSATYNADNEQTERGSKKLGYDAEGNLTSDGTNEYKWNARGQLASISGGTTASFAYDPFGRRTSKTISGTTTKDLYDGPNLAQETHGSSTANLLTGLSPDETFARTTSTATESLLTDALGSTIALGGSTGKAETSYTYDPFGATSKEGTVSENPFQYAGRENDGDGLYDNRARYYSPAAARFISQDPQGQEANGLNLYRYVDNSPANATDPYGTSLKAPAPGGGGSTGSGGSGGGGGTGGSPGTGGSGRGGAGIGFGPHPTGCNSSGKGGSLGEVSSCRSYENLEQTNKEDEERIEREPHGCGGMAMTSYGGRPNFLCSPEGEGPQSDEPPVPGVPLPPPGGQPGVPGIKVPTLPFFDPTPEPI
jgi:RHS repeat-associated protein